MTTPLQRVAALATMKTAFGGAYFNLCGINDACRLLGRPNHGTPDHDVLNAVHCLEWTHFDGASKQELLETCARVLGIDLSLLIEQVGTLQLKA